MRQFAVKAFVSLENRQTGFLTRIRTNPLENEEIIAFSNLTENIVNQFVGQLATALDGEVPDNDICTTLFQYVFDKTTEATYKLIIGDEIDTMFILKEAFEYHAPDLPEFIQLKLTNVVAPLCTLSANILDFLDKNECRTSDVEQWMPAYLMVAAILGIQFAQEMDLEDDSELQDFLKRQDF